MGPLVDLGAGSGLGTLVLAETLPAAHIAARLAPEAPLVLNLQPPAEPVDLPESVFTSVRVGQHLYQGSGAVARTGADTVQWRKRYRVLDEGGEIVREATTEYQWYVVSPATLLTELSAAGFDAEIGALDVVRAVAAVS